MGGKWNGWSEWKGRRERALNRLRKGGWEGKGNGWMNRRLSFLLGHISLFSKHFSVLHFLMKEQRASSVRYLLAKVCKSAVKIKTYDIWYLCRTGCGFLVEVEVYSIITVL